jgi:polyhydroxybutyrate depolymerase
MKKTLLFSLLLAFSFFAKAQNFTDSFLVDGTYRNFILHVPAGFNASVNHPLVLNLHGYTSNASQQQLYTKMDAVSDTFQFLVVYPNGIGNYWNSFGSGVDDVKFLRNLVDTISVRYKVNAKRVYSCGMSNGGFMTYTLACQMGDKLAAVASVTGTMSNNTLANCPLAHKMPVLHIHGTLDPTVNYANGITGSIGVEQTVAFWRDTNDCTQAPDTISIPNISSADGCTAQLIRYKNCDAGSEVYFYKITNGGHTWPNGLIDISGGFTNRDFDASNAIWEFFNRHTLDGTQVGIANLDLQVTTQLYPNPFSNEIKIAAEDKIESVEVFDVLGNKLLQENNHPSLLNTTSLSNGIYLVKINFANSSVVKKVVKN